MEWSEYHMGFAKHAALKSKDSTQVGAALIAPDGRSILATGFNGPPRGVRDLPERRERPAKYQWTSHAEANLIALAARHGIRTQACAVIVTHHPCSSCARSMIQAGIAKIFYGPGTTSMPAEEFEVARIMCEEACVELIAQE